MFGRTNAPRIIVFALSMALWARSAQAVTIIRVDVDAPGPVHDGETWATAYTDLQAALAVAADGDQVWVAAGVYYPSPILDDREATFQIPSGVSYGRPVRHRTRGMHSV